MSGTESFMNFFLREYFGQLRLRFTLLVGQSKHVGFRYGNLVWQKSIPKMQAWRVVLAELDSHNPIFFFGYLPDKPSDLQLAEWVDICLHLGRKQEDEKPVSEIVLGRKLQKDYPQTLSLLERRGLYVSSPADGFDAGIHRAKAADDAFHTYSWRAADEKSPAIKAEEGWLPEGAAPLAAVSGVGWETNVLFWSLFIRRHLVFHGLDTTKVDKDIEREQGWVRERDEKSQ
jgi:hypothetical protein